MAETQTPTKPVYKDTSVSDWMNVIKTDDLAPIGKPPEPAPDPKPKPDATTKTDDSPVVPTGKSIGKEPAKEVQPATVSDSTPAAKEDGEEKWPRTAVEWDKRKKDQQARLDAANKERDEIKAERDKVKSEIETLRKQGPSPELDDLKKQRDELSDKLRLVAVEQHPKFKAYFENKTNSQLELAKRIAGPDKGERIVALLKAPEGPIRDQELESALAELNTVQQARIASVLNSLADIDSERSSEIAKARDSFDKIQAEQTESQKQAQVKQEQSFNDLISGYSDKDKGNPIFQKRDGDEAWNKGVDERVEMAKVLLFGNPGQDNVMKAALAAVSLPALIEHGKSVMAENEKLKAQIKELSAAQPKVEAQQPKATGTQMPKAGKSTNDPMTAAAEWMKVIHAPAE